MFTLGLPTLFSSWESLSLSSCLILCLSSAILLRSWWYCWAWKLEPRSPSITPANFLPSGIPFCNLVTSDVWWWWFNIAPVLGSRFGNPTLPCCTMLASSPICKKFMSGYNLRSLLMIVGHVNNIPTMKFLTGIFRITPSNHYSCYHWLNTSGKSKIPHWRIFFPCPIYWRPNFKPVMTFPKNILKSHGNT